MQGKEFILSLRNARQMSGQSNEEVICLFLMRGKLTLEVDQESYQLTANDFFVINPFQRYQLLGTEENLFLYLHFKRTSVGEYFPHQQVPFFKNYLPGSEEDVSQEFREVLTRMMVVYFRDQAAEQLELYQYFFNFLANLTKYLKDEAVEQMVRLPENDRMLRALELIQKHYMTDLTLEDIAEALDLSYYHCSRLFKKELGVSFSQYLNRIRLEAAARELLHSSQSILKIALNNGFANVKTFHQVFKKEFGVTPNDYRKEHQGEAHEPPTQTTDHYQEMTQAESLQLLTNYLIDKDIEVEQVSVEKRWTFSTADRSQGPLVRKKKIIKIGRAENGLTQGVQSELTVLQNELGFDLIQFSDFCQELVVAEEATLISGNIFNNQWFDFLMAIELTPMIDLLIPLLGTKAELQDWCDQKLELLKYFLNRYGREAVDQWYVELDSPDWNELHQWAYLYFFQRVKQFAPKLHVGILGLTSLAASEQQVFAKFMRQQKGHLPDFINFQADPYVSEQTKEGYAKKFKYYQRAILDKINEQLVQFEGYEPELFLTDWNTLVGEGDAFSGTFFRSALILESIIELSQTVSGLAFWLDIKVKEKDTKKREDSSLSVFMYEQLRRPLFFSIEFLHKLKGEVLANGAGYLLTEAQGTYYLLVYNSSYIDPMDSVDTLQIEDVTKRLSVQLTDLTDGTYMIRRYLLDKDHGGLYNGWVRAGSRSGLERELLEYLRQKIRPEFELMIKEVTAGSLTFKPVLTLNACQMFVVNRKA